MRDHSVLLAPLMLGMIACCSAQTTTTQQYFESLNADNVALRSQADLQGAIEQIAGMTPDAVRNALPAIFKAVKLDGIAGLQAAFAVTAVAGRKDSGDLLSDRIPEIAAMLNLKDPRFKTFAAMVFMSMKPVPTDKVVPILSSFILRGAAAPGDKIAPAGALVAIAPAAAETEQSLLYLLGLPMDATIRTSLIEAVGRNTIKSAKVMDAVAQSLDDSNEDILLAAIQSIDRMGPAAVERCKVQLSKLAMDSDQPEPVRRLSQDALNNTTDDCRTLSRLHMGACPAP